MADRPVILDTGPLVAALVSSDQHHRWALECLKRIRPPMITCEPVLAESFFLLSRVHGGPELLWQAIAGGLVEVHFRAMDQLARLGDLMARYADQPMSLADACLVRLSELHDTARVFTLDHHFSIYRRNGRQKIPLIAPWA